MKKYFFPILSPGGTKLVDYVVGDVRFRTNADLRNHKFREVLWLVR